MSRIPLLSAAVVSAGITNGVSAQWMVINLNPTPATETLARGIHAGQQVGQAAIAGHPIAILWNGTADSWVSLNPRGSIYSTAHAVHNGHQVGWTMVAGIAHASLWSSTADSWVDLHPNGADYSEAF